jgi:hypothetical protein
LTGQEWLLLLFLSFAASFEAPVKCSQSPAAIASDTAGSADADFISFSAQNRLTSAYAIITSCRIIT